MPFEKGHKKTGGKVKGSIHPLTKQMRTVKETVLSVFNKIQDDPKVKLEQFAKDYPRDFYAIAAKLIPTEVTAEVKQEITLKGINEIEIHVAK